MQASSERVAGKVTNHFLHPQTRDGCVPLNLTLFHEDWSLGGLPLFSHVGVCGFVLIFLLVSR